MSLKYFKVGLVILVGSLSVAALILWFNLSQLTKKFAQEQVPGLSIGSVALAWNRVDLTDFSYTAGGSSAISVTAGSVRAHPTFLSFLREEIEVAQLDIDGAWFRLVRKEKREAQPSPTNSQTTTQPRARANLNEINISNGKGEITDETVPGSPARVTLENLDLRLRNLKYPTAAGSTAIEAYCVIKGQPDGRAQLNGWIDPVNQSAELRLNSTSVDLKNLRPYFKDRLPTIQNADGTASLRADFTMVNGIYNAAGELTVEDLHFPESEGDTPRLPKLLLTQYLKLRGNRLTIPFKITGDLKNQEHRLDLSALLSGILSQELGDEALQKRIGAKRSLEDLDQDLRRLKDKARELRKLF